ncbi:MAG: hypothetical protein JOY80_09170 [Candidatus Dormibacteraeota bacterium]|nr:hypothetical protein [Candidatus Dormibacteraeota bacterium]
MSKSSRRLMYAVSIVAVAAGATIAVTVRDSAVQTSLAASPTKPIALHDYAVSVFAQSTASYWNPDSLEISGDRTWLFVGYQNTTAKDGSDGKSSTVVQYDLKDGHHVQQTWSVLGHVDGLRQDPSGGNLWVLSNEDGNPHLTVIDPVRGTKTVFSMTSVNGGGGFDDIAFIASNAFISASNPANTSPNPGPAVVKATLNTATHHVDTTPVLWGNASATDVTSDQTVSLNEIDPDSLYVLPGGVLQLDNQAGSELVFIHNPGTAQQTVSRLGIGNQQDDTILPTAAKGVLFVADTSAGVIYRVQSDHFETSLYYSSAPNDSGVPGIVGTIDPTDPNGGQVSPIIIGLNSPHGEAFLARS